MQPRDGQERAWRRGGRPERLDCGKAVEGFGRNHQSISRIRASWFALRPDAASRRNCGVYADHRQLHGLWFVTIPTSGDPGDPLHAVFPRRNQWSCGMNARVLIDEASFGAETVKAMGEAFDQAWARIAPTFGNCPPE